MSELTENVQVSDKQLNIIREALDLYCRLLWAQIDSPLWSLWASRKIDHEKFDAICRELKQHVFPELHFNASYGVGWTEGDRALNNAQIAYEIEAMLRHLIWKRTQEPPYVTSAYPSLHYSTEPLPKLERIAARAERLEAENAELKSALADYGIEILPCGRHQFVPAKLRKYAKLDRDVRYLEMEAENEKLRAALEIYANPENWTVGERRMTEFEPPCQIENGFDFARRALNADAPDGD